MIEDKVIHLCIVKPDPREKAMHRDAEDQPGAGRDACGPGVPLGTPLEASTKSSPVELYSPGTFSFI